MAAPVLPRIPRKFYAAMFLQYAIGGAFLPFVTLYFRDQGTDYGKLAWIFLVSSAVGSTMPLVWGYVADRLVSLERLIASLHVVGAGLLLLLSLSDSFALKLLVFPAIVGVLMPTNALLNALAYHNLESPETQFGRLRLWGSLGWMVPSLPIFLWLALSEELDLTFTLYLASGFELSMAFFALSLPHTPPGGVRAEGTPRSRVTYGQALRHLFHHRGFARFLFVIFLMHGSFAILFYYSPPLLENLGVARKWVGPFQCVGVIAEIPMFLALPWAIRRLGYGWTLTVGCAALGLRQLCYATTSGVVLLLASYALAGVCVVFYLIAASLALNAIAGREIRATAQTIFSITGHGLGQMVGHQIAGHFAGLPSIGLRGVFVFATVTAGVACLIASTLAGRGVFRRQPEHPSEPDAQLPPDGPLAG